MTAMDWGRLLEEAKWVVTLFDQANTNRVVERLGSRGEALKGAVDDLRKVMTDHGVDPWGVKGGTWSVGHGPAREAP